MQVDPASPPTIVSLFDYSGVWSEPYRLAGYRVLRFDLGLASPWDGVPNDVMKLREEHIPFAVHGVLAAPPCDHFAASGARHWAAKDADGRTREGCAMIRHTLRLIERLCPTWWVLENPVGRLPTLFENKLGRPAMYFHPWEFAGHADNPEAEAYTKKSALWGSFCMDLERSPRDPVMHSTTTGKRGAWYWKNRGGSSLKTKRLRSKTPQGFARAFFEANP